jgi:hypothetical protein
VTFRSQIWAVILLCAPLPARARPAGSPPTAGYVDPTQQHGDTEIRALEPARQLAHGDRVVTLVSWYMLGGSGGFTVVNALPPGLAYQTSADGDEDVSIDGGKSWGKLAQLHRGARHATPEDVTHVRWHVSPRQAMNGAGRIAYSGFVR